MIKKLLPAAAAICILAAVGVFDCSAAEISAKSAIVIESSTGTVLYEKDADNQMLIASTTKIMTALVALENSDIDSVVTVPAACEGVEGSSLYLKAGEQLTLRELLYGMMLESGNDAAVAVAYHVSGSIEDFAKLMNDRAEALGCENTHFVNPNGLDADGHYSSARDLAKIMSEAMENELFEQIVSTKTISFGGRSFTNHNKLLWSYDGVVGGKTGYTKSAGRTLVTCAERDGMRLICVTLCDSNDWSDHMALYDEAFSNWEAVRICRAGEPVSDVSVISGESDTVGVCTDSDLRLIVRRGSETKIELELPEFVYAEVSEGALAGYLRVINGSDIFTKELYYADTVPRDSSEKLSGWDKIKRALSDIVGRSFAGLGYEPEN
ncbi:MAG: D-alanyl-D-alanine carboxypeptidase family protein [Oscillospiraceae bacterium]